MLSVIIKWCVSAEEGAIKTVWEKEGNAREGALRLALQLDLRAGRQSRRRLHPGPAARADRAACVWVQWRDRGGETEVKPGDLQYPGGRGLSLRPELLMETSVCMLRCTCEGDPFQHHREAAASNHGFYFPHSALFLSIELITSFILHLLNYIKWLFL